MVSFWGPIWEVFNSLGKEYMNIYNKTSAELMMNWSVDLDGFKMGPKTIDNTMPKINKFLVVQWT